MWSRVSFGDDRGIGLMLAVAVLRRLRGGGSIVSDVSWGRAVITCYVFKNTEQKEKQLDFPNRDRKRNTFKAVGWFRTIRQLFDSPPLLN